MTVREDGNVEGEEPEEETDPSGWAGGDPTAWSRTRDPAAAWAEMSDEDREALSEAGQGLLDISVEGIEEAAADIAEQMEPGERENYGRVAIAEARALVKRIARDGMYPTRVKQVLRDLLRVADALPSRSSRQSQQLGILVSRVQDATEQAIARAKPSSGTKSYTRIGEDGRLEDVVVELGGSGEERRVLFRMDHDEAVALVAAEEANPSPRYNYGPKEEWTLEKVSAWDPRKRRAFLEDHPDEFERLLQGGSAELKRLGG